MMIDLEAIDRLVAGLAEAAKICDELTALTDDAEANDSFPATDQT